MGKSKDEIKEILGKITPSHKLKKSLFDEKNSNLSETQIEQLSVNEKNIPVFINEFWTPKQRKASPLHEISYRACFKPQLPRFFIERFSEEMEKIYDPFGGRGTTAIEAGLLGRIPLSNDINPLSKILSLPRLHIPSLEDIKKRLTAIPIDFNLKAEIDLSMFFHPDTEAEILSLKNWLDNRRENGYEDNIDRWIRMVATNRLTGHSKGFFSIYTLPPNQAASSERQKIINEKLGQKPDYRNTQEIIINKTVNLTKKITQKEIKSLSKIRTKAKFLEKDAASTPEIEENSVQLIITSPPFLDTVDYCQDNWLRLWFNSIDPNIIAKEITVFSNVKKWAHWLKGIFKEFHRVVKEDGWVFFEVGEVKRGKIDLAEYVIPVASEQGFDCKGLLINMARFSKTSNIWGVINNQKGTNSNRVIFLKKTMG